MVSEIFWPEGGGAELATYLILKILRDTGHKITVVTGTSSPALIKCIKFYYTNLLGNHNRVERWRRVYLLSKESWFINLLSSHDIFYIPLFAYPLIPIAKKYDIKVIVHMHNYVAVRYHGVKYYFEKDKLNTLEELKIGLWHEMHVQKSLTRTLFMPVSYILYKIGTTWLEHADTIICVSKRQAEIIKACLPQLHKKIVVIYNPLPPLPDLKKNMSRIPTFLYVGGYNLVKGFPIVLKLFMELHKQGFKFKLYMAGDYNKCKYVIPSTIPIKILGRIPYAKLLELYKEAWALIFPSICEEPLPYAILESILTDTIPIAPKTGGIIELLQGAEAEKYLFTPNNIKQLVSIVRDLINTDIKNLTYIAEKTKKQIIKRIDERRLKLFTIFNSFAK